MASVYKAERAGEMSALKRPLALLLDDREFLERFLREAEIGRALNHPNIVRILSRGKVDDVPYFTMELLPGQTLQAYLGSSGAPEPRIAAMIMAQVAEALDFAHSKGVIHRDLKPSNIMLLRDGTAKVMDFGIAQARRFEGLTATGAFLGTPDYVAPEVIEGKGAEPRSDLYSLGAVFYELLTGRRLFTGETAFAVLKKHVGEEAPRPSEFQPAIPPELDALVRRLLAKSPEARPASTEELVVALRDWLNRAA
jgi:serine/threonine-protein kinase